jgi:hypothetical protein
MGGGGGNRFLKLPKSEPIMGIKNLRARIRLHSARKCRKEAELLKAFYIKTFSAKFQRTRTVFDEFGATPVVPIYFYDRIGNHPERRVRCEIKTVEASFFYKPFGARLHNFCKRDFRNKLGLICQ